MSAYLLVLLQAVSADFASDLSVAGAAAASLNSQVNSWSAADGLLGALGIQSGFTPLSNAVLSLSNDGSSLKNSDIDVSTITSFSSAVGSLLQSLTQKAADFKQVQADPIVANDIQALGGPAAGILSEILTAVASDCEKISSLLPAYSSVVDNFSSADGQYSLSNPNFPAVPSCSAAAAAVSSAPASSAASSAPIIASSAPASSAITSAPVVSSSIPAAVSSVPINSTVPIAVTSAPASVANSSSATLVPVVTTSPLINSTHSESSKPSATGTGAAVGGNNSTVPGYVNTTTIDNTKWVTIPCSTPTTVTYGGSTYTVSHATTLTVKDCGCTDTVPGGAPGGKPSAPGGSIGPVAGSSSGVPVANNGLQTAVGFSAAVLGVVALFV